MMQAELLPHVNLSKQTRSAHEAVVADRRHFHRTPEVGLELPKTAAFIEERLKELGIPCNRPVEYGVVGLIEGRKDGPTVMLRSDMDALPMTEETSHEYVSTHEGMMHACGHDTHMAMLLAAAKQLKEEGIDAGRIKLVFQPGEEGHHGAESLVKAGVLENPKVEVAYGQHIWAHAPVGQVLIEDGPVMAAVDTVYVTIEGKGTHAAMPNQGVDPLYAGAQIVTALQSIVTRNIDPLEPAVVTVSMFHAGTAHNIIPPQAELTLSVRVFDDTAHQIIERRVKEIINGLAENLGCKAKINYMHEHSATANTPEIAQIVREEASAMVGEENVIPEQRTLGAEDMSDYLKHVPGAFPMIGAYNEAKDCKYPHHHPKFNIDEDALAIGAELVYRVARRLLAR